NLQIDSTTPSLQRAVGEARLRASDAQYSRQGRELQGRTQGYSSRVKRGGARSGQNASGNLPRPRIRTPGRRSGAPSSPRRSATLGRAPDRSPPWYSRSCHERRMRHGGAVGLPTAPLFSSPPSSHVVSSVLHPSTPAPTPPSGRYRPPPRRPE